MTNIPSLRSLSIVLLFLLLTPQLYALQKDITGVVKDSINNNLIEGVVVKLFDANKKLVSFSLTDSNGAYKLPIKESKPPLLVVFQHFSYKIKEITLLDNTRTLNALLSEKEVALREVTIKPPEITLKKDTISYRVDAFQQLSDRTIEDVLKRMPGISVADNGLISYQGRGISKFNIEGLDMLGGKYTLASKNINAKDVSRVEVIENYQAVKQLEGEEYSDNVALDLKLKKEAKMRLLLNAEVGGGIREDEGLYHGVLTGMTFNPKFQFLGTVKANNFGVKLSNETMDHFGSAFTSNIAENVMSGDGLSYPPLSFQRYHDKKEQIASLNSLLKISESETFRVNVDYNREKSSFDYDIKSSYFIDGGSVVVNEYNNPNFFNNTLKAGLKYQLNSSDLYLDNQVFYYTKGVDNNIGLKTDDNRIQQNKDSRLNTLRNTFTLFKKHNKNQYRFSSTLNYSYLPDNHIAFSGVPDVEGAYYQKGYGETFSTQNNLSFGYTLSRVSKLGVNLYFGANYDNVNTLLQKNDTSFCNKNDGYKITTSASLNYDLLSVDKRYGLSLKMPISVYVLDYRNRINTQANLKDNYVYVNPSLSAHYVFSSFTKMHFRSGFSNTIGDITDFLLNPIQTSYRQQSVRSGILASSKRFSTSLGAEYKNPLSLFFSNAAISYSNTQRNILRSQTITNDDSNVDINSSGVAKTNTSQSLSFSASANKRVKAIATTFSLAASYGISTGSQMRQDVKVNTRSNSFSLTPQITTQIIKNVDIGYSMSYYCSYYKSGQSNSVYHQQSHNISADYNFIKNLFLFASMNINRIEITEGNYVNVSVLDAGAKYKNDKVEVEFKLNNLLNNKKYRYTVVSDLDVFSYTYYLKPVEGVITFRFNL
ncbi:hypothetical protein M2138_000686 [Dysgonomonadaceae bacterium PH5-43]|nr:hypothetical protein [Dysgonomonadaceae bacterium PH5-43]